MSHLFHITDNNRWNPCEIRCQGFHSIHNIYVIRISPSDIEQYGRCSTVHLRRDFPLINTGEGGSFHATISRPKSPDQAFQLKFAIIDYGYVNIAATLGDRRVARGTEL